MEKLAILGGAKAVKSDVGDIFTWPIITDEDRNAVLDVLNDRAMSGTDITRLFEVEYAAWIGRRYALGFNNGTSALHAAMYAVGIGKGDEIICQSNTYWASCLPCFSLKATVVFADIERHTLCIDPQDIEHRISEDTKAIVVVHYNGYPAPMDEILRIAKKYNLKVIEDVSHAHGALYKGKPVGTFGDVAAMSLMTGKAFAIGEAGMLVTDDKKIYQRALAFGHYERNSSQYIDEEELLPYLGLPLGGYKYRMHQMSAAVGRVQLKHYNERMEEIQRSMNYFWDLLEGVPGIKAHRPDKNSGSTMGGWYNPKGLYYAEELWGLSIETYIKALKAEGVSSSAGGNIPLHTHRLFRDCDIYNDGKPTRIAHAKRDVRELDKSIVIGEKINRMSLRVPWFKKFHKDIIEEHAEAFRKIGEQYKDLL
jgi:perosamine synthetase